MKDNNDGFVDTSNLRVVYVIYVGVDIDGYNVYQFLLSDNTDDTFSEGWDEKPAGNIRNDVLMIPDSMYDYAKQVRTDIKLDLAQDNFCFSMQDCRDHCIALAYENLDNAEEYPENGRIVIQFGDPIDKVEVMFMKRDFKMNWI